MELYEIKDELEKVILIAVNTKDEKETAASLDELKELVETAGAIPVGRMIQNREQINSATYIGKGKIEELKEYIESLEATGIVCDDELSPAQLKNLEAALNTKVMDRTLIILDIFAKRALTKEGKIQVELAQLKYRSARLVGLRSSLSRLGGGIGTRGPGEKKLEMDRRLISDRIAELRRDIEDIERHRDLSRSKRSENSIPVISIVGYTNAGKSTLLNRLTDAKILEEDKLFATLDPTTRNYKLPMGQEVLFTDTVGFIRKLPHHLIDAFKSTLEEAKYADIIVHVVDASNPQADAHMQVVYETLDNLKVGEKPVITILNKQDKIGEENNIILKDERAEYVIKASIKQEIGIGDLVEAVEEILKERSIYLEKVFDYGEAGKIQLIRKYGQLISEEYVAEGILVKANVPNEIYGRL
ncbi:MAG: GTPase HflX [Lachnospiraceae bacterium]|nr:GTPase HflX [Lachnospiraceae bacterium]MDE6697853.1 GTPase HflX [Lachnospiraceae bacterium]